jgi:membrane protease subunit HflC
VDCDLLGLCTVVGFSLGGWVIGGSAREMAEDSAAQARQELAAVVCVDRFMAAPDAGVQLTALQEYIVVNLFARWRINDPLQYFLRLRDERSAQFRLDDILGSETRNAVAKHELIEIIRTTKDRVPLCDAQLTEAEREQDIGSLVPIQKGRKLVEREIFAAASPKVEVFGIELLDIRFKRINYDESVRPKIYDRMISERRQIAERFLSEGNGEAARIRGNRLRDLNKIQSEAYRSVEEIRGMADAKGHRNLRERLQPEP